MQLNMLKVVKGARKKRKDRKKEHEGGKNLRSSEHVSHIALLQTYSSDDSYDSPAVYKGENRKQSNILAYFVGILLFAMVVGVFFYIFQQNKEKKSIFQSRARK